jgi:hypothetical protein
MKSIILATVLALTLIGCQTPEPPKTIGTITAFGFGITEEAAKKDAWADASKQLLKTGKVDVVLVQVGGFEPQKGPRGYEYVMEFAIRKKK